MAKKKSKKEVAAPAPKKSVKRVAKKRAVEDELKKAPAVSVEAMIAENTAATVSTDYQKYLRKLMKQAGNK